MEGGKLKINMSHGSGGNASQDLMKNIFAKHFSNEILDKMEDAAVLEVNGKIAFSTDSFVVTPLFFKGGDIGKLAICGTTNDLLMMGATPKYITVGFIMEEGLEVSDLEKIVVSMKEAAIEAGVKIVAGDTKVVEGNGGLYINTSGIGIIKDGVDISALNCKPGDIIILSGNLGDHHACILSERMKIENNIKSDCAPLNGVVFGLLDNGINVKAMRDVTRGGLGTILNEIALSSNCSMEIIEKNLPVSETVRSFCEILGLDPLYMGNEGKMLAIVSEEDGDRALKIMSKITCSKDSVIIGKIVDGKGVYMKTTLGGKRVIDILYGEGLPRIC